MCGVWPLAHSRLECKHIPAGSCPSSSCSADDPGCSLPYQSLISSSNRNQLCRRVDIIRVEGRAVVELDYRLSMVDSLVKQPLLWQLLQLLVTAWNSLEVTRWWKWCNASTRIKQSHSHSRGWMKWQSWVFLSSGHGAPVCDVDRTAWRMKMMPYEYWSIFNQSYQFELDKIDSSPWSTIHTIAVHRWCLGAPSFMMLKDLSLRKMV